MPSYPQPVESLIESLSSLPGIGSKSAERITFHILRMPVDQALGLSEAIRKAKQDLRQCNVCFNITTHEICEICSNPSRDQTTVCVVEQPKDLLAFESTSEYRGVYHVLLGRISPLEGIAPENLTIDALVQRVKNGSVNEVILATNPDLEGDNSALYLSNLLQDLPARVTRIAKGIPSGSQIEHVGKTILTDALRGRMILGTQS
ncbi:MAG: recombination mediator RecR [Planctomycetota bacterium]|jgi:recombination protein RecR|nr:recombination mediator RecR [Planctomycetota bacterium]